MKTETIVSCSSGSSANVAVSLIRISGFNFLDSLQPIVELDLKRIKPRYSHYTKIIFDKKIIDDVILVFYPNPHSYNGEDVLEISVHGNRLNVERILNLIQNISEIRLAHPGEFTERALKNKKLTLSQVEGLDLLLNANSLLALDQGLSLLAGSLRQSFLDLHTFFVNHRSALEMGFDFLDDIGEDAFKQNLQQTFMALKLSIEELHNHVVDLPFGLINPSIILTGQPNAGKSTLFNKLLGVERAIVSDRPGTTRDYLEKNLRIAQVNFNLIDTAGLRETEDIVEQKGIEQTKELVKEAFFKILLVNAAVGLDLEQDIGDIDLVLITHIDKVAEDQIVDLKKEISGSMGPLQGAGSMGPLYSANLCDENTDLIEKIFDLIASKYKKILDFDPILIERHQSTIKNLKKSMDQYSEVFNDSEDLAIVASEFNSVGNCISELIGIVSPDSVLNNIFSNFCIGK